MNRDGFVVENFVKTFQRKTENLFLRLTREKRKETRFDLFAFARFLAISFSLSLSQHSSPDEHKRTNESVIVKNFDIDFSAF